MDMKGSLPNRSSTKRPREDQDTYARKQTHLNNTQEDEQTRQWVAKEDDFVLQQANSAAIIRVKDGRAKPIDWLAVALQVIDSPDSSPEDDVSDLDVVNPDGVFDDLRDVELQELQKNITAYLALEKKRSHKEFWETMSVICNDRRQSRNGVASAGRAVSSVSSDIDGLLRTKSHDQLVTLEKQIRGKLESNEPIDVDYWEQLLRSLLVWKARAKLKDIYESLISTRVENLRRQQKEEAESVKSKLEKVLKTSPRDTESGPDSSRKAFTYGRILDPEPLLKIRAEDKDLEVMEEGQFLDKVVSFLELSLPLSNTNTAKTADRQKTLNLGYVPMKQRTFEKQALPTSTKAVESSSSVSRFAAPTNDDFSQATTALYEREVARGVNEDEEIFAGEEELATAGKPQWAGKHRPRKPRYFNRVQMGYEWNKYNQTHYDHDNPPPKVVQGYKFNIFYPDLIDKTRAPTYRIEREHGRKRGESFAPAGEEDTCLIRFISGPPYEDVAFRIVDKEWDYSAKRERGFRSSFDKGILQLHFQFKKVSATSMSRHLMLSIPETDRFLRYIIGNKFGL
jgi:hypothetical protein